MNLTMNQPYLHPFARSRDISDDDIAEVYWEEINNKRAISEFADD